MGDSGKVGGIRKSGTHDMNQNDAIALAVSTALQAVLPEVIRQVREESNDGRAEHRMESIVTNGLKEVRSEMKEGFGKVETNMSDFRTALAAGSTKFAVQATEILALKERLDDHSDLFKRAGYPSAFHPTPSNRGTSSALHPTRREKPDEKPLISQKVWNAMLLAALTALAAGAGGLVWERIRGPDEAKVTTTTTTTVSAPMVPPAVVSHPAPAAPAGP